MISGIMKIVTFTLTVTFSALFGNTVFKSMGDTFKKLGILGFLLFCSYMGGLLLYCYNLGGLLYLVYGVISILIIHLSLWKLGFFK